MANDGETKKKRALVALDESEESFHSLKWALDYVLWPGDTVILLHCADEPPPFVVGAPVVLGAPLPSEVIRTYKTHQESLSKKILDKARNICEGRGLEIECVAVEGDARANICSQVQMKNADVLIMGSHGYGAFKRAFLGSVSDYCVHNVKCPVLIVKKPGHRNA